MRACLVLMSFGFQILLCAQALAITPEKFDALPCYARTQYVSHLIRGAEKGLQEHGQKDSLEKLQAVMAKSNDQFYTQFYGNLQEVRDVNAANAAKPNNRNAPALYEVEHALALTTKQNGVIVPVSW